ncbi:MAG: hypothetical protein JRI23_32215 [Deltaproteobacteria bacterium]|jgi:hypothetical protein|nr:hypothetical protein [Deltaproteobacteria bacterium]MBW2536906.1 hypothetical protein [Deltaproteobacteria bacterium]
MVRIAILLLVVSGLPFFWAAHTSRQFGQEPIALVVTAVDWLAALLLYGVRKRTVRTSVQAWCVSALAIVGMWLARVGNWAWATNDRYLPMTVAVIVQLVLCGLVFLVLMGKEATAAYPSARDAVLASSKAPATLPPARPVQLIVGAVAALAALVGGGYWVGMRAYDTVEIVISAELDGQAVERGDVFIGGASLVDCRLLPCPKVVHASREIHIRVVAGDAEGEVTLTPTEDQQVIVKLASAAASSSSKVVPGPAHQLTVHAVMDGKPVSKATVTVLARDRCK